MNKNYSSLLLLLIAFPSLFIAEESFIHLGTIKLDIKDSTKVLSTSYHYTRPSIIILNPSKILEYTLYPKEDFGKLMTYDHKITDLLLYFKTAKMDRSAELFVSERSLWVLDDRNNFESVKKYTKEVMAKDLPKDFKVSSFTNIIKFNPYAFRSVMKVGKHNAIEFSYTDFHHSRTTKVAEYKPVALNTPSSPGLGQTTLTGEIIDLQYVDYGEMIAILYDNKHLAVTRGKKNEKKDRYYPAPTIVKSTFTEYPRFIITCDYSEMYGVALSTGIDFFNSKTNKFVKFYKFPTGFNLKTVSTPKHLKMMMLFSDKTILFLDLLTFGLIDVQEIPTVEGLNLKWQGHLPETDVFVARHDSTDRKKVVFSAYQYKKTDIKYCVPSCGPKPDSSTPCKRNFTPCSYVVQFFYTVLWIAIVFGIIIFAFIGFSLYKSTDGGDSKSKEKEREGSTITLLDNDK